MDIFENKQRVILGMDEIWPAMVGMRLYSYNTREFISTLNGGQVL